MGRIKGGSPPVLEATFAQLRGFDPRQSQYGEIIGHCTVDVPVTSIPRLYLYAYWWTEPGGPTRRWMGGLPCNVLNAFIKVLPETVSIVLGKDLEDENQPYVARDCGYDLPWVRIINTAPSDFTPGLVHRSEVLIPCIEVVRYHYGHVEMLRDAFNGDILLRRKDFRYPNIAFDGSRFRAMSRQPTPFEAAQGGYRTCREVAPDQISYAYRQLRGIAWNMIARTQSNSVLLLEALPPVLGEVNIHGEIWSEGDLRNYRVTIFRITSILNYRIKLGLDRDDSISSTKSDAVL